MPPNASHQRPQSILRMKAAPNISAPETIAPFGKAICPSSAAAVMNDETPISSASLLKVNPLARIVFTQALLSASRSLASSDITHSCCLVVDGQRVEDLISQAA